MQLKKLIVKFQHFEVEIFKICQTLLYLAINFLQCTITMEKKPTRSNHFFNHKFEKLISTEKI